MDLYVEQQCIEQMKQGNLKQFLLLFDANFDALYRYVARRVGQDGPDLERIGRLVFLDALGQVQNTPSDSGYLVWLYSLAKPRVWDFMAKASFPETQGLIMGQQKNAEVNESKTEKEFMLEKTENMLRKLSLEEREILRLKFFEEVTDGDVMVILGIQEGAIGPKIYRVLKRAHFLLFGESDERQGVYFGELGAFMGRIREMENIAVVAAFKLSLRADLSARVDRRDFALDAEAAEEVAFKEPPVKIINEEGGGSDDPAKIFVEAVREMREEEKVERLRAEASLEKQERFMDFVEKWKGALAMVPVAIFLVLVIVFLMTYFKGGGYKGKTDRVYVTDCKIEVAFDGEFSDGEIRSVNQGISDRICGKFDVKNILISRREDGRVDVKVAVTDWFLQYQFANKLMAQGRASTDWRIKEYFRIGDVLKIWNG